MLINQIIPIGEVSQSQKLRMYNLYSENYNHTSKELFFSDLANKQFVIMVFDESHEIQGFSTAGINPKNCGTQNYNILFSGDTIISPEHWGTQELLKGFMTLVGKLLASDKEKEWYWFLISKGHRTYMYLALFFKAYYPHVKKTDPKLKHILNEVASKMFPESWLPEKDLIVFPEKMGELTPELAKGSFNKTHNKHVAFFLEKNPHFYRGEELACITSLSFENIHPRQHNNLEKGYTEGIPNFSTVKISV